jgi:ABC-type lipoprotein release transport system permease subunit
MKENLFNLLRSFIAGFGILFLVIFFALYLSIRDTVTAYIGESLLDNLASDEIKIVHRNSKSLDFVKTADSPAISSAIAWQIKSMPYFSEVNALSRVGLNVRIRGELLGQRKSVYLPVCGIDRTALRGKVSNWRGFVKKEPVPVIVPAFTVDILNNYLAMNGIPAISSKEFVGFPVELRFITGERNTEAYRSYKFDGEIYGFTNFVSFTGIILPTSFLRSVAATYRKETGKSAGFEYVVIYAKVKDTDMLPEIEKKLKSLGLKVESQKEIVEKTKKTMAVIDGVFFSILAVFFIVSVVSIFNSYLTLVYIRSQKFSLKRVLGFSKLQILFFFLIEAAFIGAFYGGAGFFIGNIIIKHANVYIAKWLPFLTSISLSPNGVDVLILSIILSSSICAVSAFLPALFASNINLFKAVRR